jgi:hypothetical protein
MGKISVPHFKSSFVGCICDTFNIIESMYGIFTEKFARKKIIFLGIFFLIIIFYKHNNNI